MKVLTTMLATAAALALAPSAQAQAQQQGQPQGQAPAQVTMSVDFDSPQPVIEPEVYGQFAEHLGRGIYEGIWVGTNSRIPNTNGYRNDVTEALRHINVPVVRWPGGCFADEYDWRDGIGPRNKRPTRVNTHWGGVVEDNSFGTHEFMNYSEMLGTKTYVAGNMGSLPPIEMGRWVEYMTSDADATLANMRRENGREEPWKIDYFGVGNESWGCGGNMQPEYSADLHRRYQTFVKTPRGVEPIVRVATGANVDDYNFTEVLMRDARNQMDAISLHYYTFPGSWENKGAATGFTEEAWASTLRNALRMDELVTRHVTIMDRYDPEKRVALYVDEWGTWYDQEPGSTPGFLYQQNSIRDAEVAALTLNIFHRHTSRVKMANIAQMVNVLQAMILTDGEDMLLTPTYHVFDMYQPFKGATPLPASVAGPQYRHGDISLPMVDVSVARGTDGRLYMALVNLDPNQPAQVNTGMSGSATGRILVGTELDTHNTFEQPERLVPQSFSGRSTDEGLVFDLPAKSVAVVAVQ